ncbi:hypothetical protein TKK_0018807 [Trichogramma kaykai]
MGILRVGGRIENAPMLTFSNKHPILLDKSCPLSTLLINYAHSQTLHGGPSQTRNFVSSQFWIVNGRSLYNKVVRSCVRCARYTNQPIQAQMADLPSCRVTGIKPFLTTGVDYAGPIRITPIRRRGDSIVLLSEEKVPPSQWPLGRVIETIKGKDNIVRVVKIKIGSKILTRPVVKLCLMPIPTPRASPDQ